MTISPFKKSIQGFKASRSDVIAVAGVCFGFCDDVSFAQRCDFYQTVLSTRLFLSVQPTIILNMRLGSV